MPTLDSSVRKREVKVGEPLDTNVDGHSARSDSPQFGRATLPKILRSFTPNPYGTGDQVQAHHGGSSGLFTGESRTTRLTAGRHEPQIRSPLLGRVLGMPTGDDTRTEKFSRRPTHEYQLEAFCAAVLRGEATLTPLADSIANMRMIDAMYFAAGTTLGAT